MRIAATLSALCAALALAPPLASGQVAKDHDVEILLPSNTLNPNARLADHAETARLITERTNKLRQEEGLSAVESEAKLAATAQYFAEYMARTNRYGHTADNKRIADRVKDRGYEYCLVSENIAYQYNFAGFASADLAQRFFAGWKRSPGHLENMLDADMAQTGVGVARSEETGYYFAVQLFGRPKSMAIEFTIANKTSSTVEYWIGDKTFPLPPQYVRRHYFSRPSTARVQLVEAVKGTEPLQAHGGDQMAVIASQGALRIVR